MDDYFGLTWVAPAAVRSVHRSLLAIYIWLHDQSYLQGSKGIVNGKVSVNVPGGIRVLRVSAFLPYFLHPSLISSPFSPPESIQPNTPTPTPHRNRHPLRARRRHRGAPAACEALRGEPVRGFCDVFKGV
jgi:hypothetical protein